MAEPGDEISLAGVRAAGCNQSDNHRPRERPDQSADLTGCAMRLAASAGRLRGRSGPAGGDGGLDSFAASNGGCTARFGLGRGGCPASFSGGASGFTARGCGGARSFGFSSGGLGPRQTSGRLRRGAFRSDGCQADRRGLGVGITANQECRG